MRGAIIVRKAKEDQRASGNDAGHKPDGLASGGSVIPKSLGRMMGARSFSGTTNLGRTFDPKSLGRSMGRCRKLWKDY